MDPIALLEQACSLAHRQVEAATSVADKATPCANFDVATLVGHMTAGLQLNASFYGGPEASLNPFDAKPIAAEQMVDEFSAATQTMFAAINAKELNDLIAHPFSPEPMPLAEAMKLPTFDMYIHAWDLSQATGVPTESPQGLHSFVDGFCRELFVGERDPNLLGDPVGAPDDASPIESLVAFLGRTPR